MAAIDKTYTNSYKEYKDWADIDDYDEDYIPKDNLTFGDSLEDDNE